MASAKRCSCRRCPAFESRARCPRHLLPHSKSCSVIEPIFLGTERSNLPCWELRLLRRCAPPKKTDFGKNGTDRFKYWSYLDLQKHAIRRPFSSRHPPRRGLATRNDIIRFILIDALSLARARRAAISASGVRDDSGFSQRPDQNQGNPTGRRASGDRYVDTDEGPEQSRYLNLKCIWPLGRAGRADELHDFT